MQTTQWKLRRVQPGMYNVAIGHNGSFSTISGLVIGGNGRWFVQRSGIQWPERYPTANKAAEALARAGFGI